MEAYASLRVDWIDKELREILKARHPLKLIHFANLIREWMKVLER